jgi:penicillin-binding protein 2
MSRRERLSDADVARLLTLGAAMLLGLGVLAAALWRTQVAHGADYRRDLMRQSVRRVRIPAVRGRIYDRHGELLADNRPGYALAIYLEDIRPRRGRRGGTMLERVTETMEEVQARIGLPSQLSEDDIRAHVRRRLPLPLVAWRDIPEAAVARWAEHAADLPGVDLLVEPMRVYPNRELMAHTLGYIGGLRDTPTAATPDEEAHYRLPEYEGRAGLERAYEDTLRGEAGGRLVPVDVAGFRRRDLEAETDGGSAALWGPGRGGEDALRRAIHAEFREPRPGRDLQLTIDLRVQRLAEAALDGHQGAVVVLDPRTGDVLALASRPAYDPNAFTPAIPTTLWRTLTEDPDAPLVHRALMAGYAPGSIFKPVVALAAIEAGRSVTEPISCSGVFMLGRHPFRCWDPLGHGPIGLRTALAQSCNVYFYQTGIAIGADAIAQTARELGLGSPTGIDLSPEAGGLVPDPAWKRANRRESWTAGDTANYSIGQGFLMTTPLQMAVAAAAIANGGTVHRPRLARGTRALGDGPFVPLPPPAPIERVVWPAAALDAVRRGMEDVVHGERGTARRLRVPGVRIAAKTGTAQYGPPAEGLKRGWMIAYAPAEAPRYAVAMMVEEAVSGGLTVAPRLHGFFEGLFADGNAEGAP